MRKNEREKERTVGRVCFFVELIEERVVQQMIGMLFVFDRWRKRIRMEEKLCMMG